MEGETGTKYVVLVDEKDTRLGTEEKLKAHKDGKLHRAISIFVFNDKDELLIQRRALEKYHCGGIWANTVCSHPRDGESYEAAAHRRLREEMGFDCELTKLFCFTYKAEFDNGLTEHEYDCVFAGDWNGTPKPDPNEIMDFKWISIDDLKEDIRLNPEKYAAWIKIALDRVVRSRIPVELKE